MRISSKLGRLARTVFRVGLMTALFTLLGFALGALAGIVTLGALNAFGSPHDMHLALPLGALPGAAVGFVTGLVMNRVFERRAKRARYSH
jgi:hypothetical protein